MRLLSSAHECLDLLVHMLVELLNVGIDTRHVVVEGREGCTNV